jgi:DTW domain-containing protein YfiP
MHPKEAYKQKTGTGRLASLSLFESEIIIGVDFTHNKRFNALINAEGDYDNFYPVVLYPSSSAFYTDTPAFRSAIEKKKLIVILIDATWPLAKKIMRINPILMTLPTISFRNPYLSQFQFKTQPSPSCLSTIESTYYLIEEFKTSGIINSGVDQSGLLTIFNQMVRFQQMFLA